MEGKFANTYTLRRQEGQVLKLRKWRIIAQFANMNYYIPNILIAS